MSAARIRLTVVLGGVLVAAIALLAWTQAWFDLTLDGGPSLVVSGQAAAPAISALGLASLALMGALSIAGRAVRIALGILETAMGGLLVAVSVSALVAPVTASASTITATTAVSGPVSIAALVSSVVVTPWPWVAVIAGALTSVVGIAVLVTSRRWPGPTRKYETAGSGDSRRPIGAWDSLSDGADPTR